ncbi:MAG TPA: amidohydrolase [Actinocrinis sp.]|jgi:amidohydrolase
MRDSEGEAPHPSPRRSTPLTAALERLALAQDEELVEFRRDLHRHPELSLAETRTTARIAERLAAAGLAPQLIPGSGLVCDIPGTGPEARPIVALRADIDALPVADEKDVPYRSTISGVCHACGHDVHASVLLGAGLLIKQLADDYGLPVPVRLIFQPAEEVLRGAALMVKEGALDGVGRILALHCDPRTEVGRVGLRSGPITSACDLIQLTLTGPGGHSSRPHLTSDVVFALASMVTGLPAALSRRLDPRSGTSIVWGHVEAGKAANAIPVHGFVKGTVRCTELDAWNQIPDLVRRTVDSMSDTFGVKTELEYTRGVPPVVNDVECTELVRKALTAVLGEGAVSQTDQSLGGEDFAWYLDHVPGAMVRLGVRSPGATHAPDLHTGAFDADERAIGVGARLFAAVPFLAA